MLDVPKLAVFVITLSLPD